MFSDSGDRIARTKIEQLQSGQSSGTNWEVHKSSDMKYHTLGYYDTISKTLQWEDKEEWLSKSPPPDSTIRKQVILTVSYQVEWKY